MVSTPTRSAAAAPAATKPSATSSSATRPPAARTPSGLQAAGHKVRGWYRGFWSALEGTGKSRNGSTYYLILGSTLALTAIGILMVSRPPASSQSQPGSRPTAALKKGGVRRHRPFRHVPPLAGQRRLAQARAWPGLGGALVLLVLVLLVGDEGPRQQELDRRGRSPSSRPRRPNWPGAVDGHGPGQEREAAAPLAPTC